MFSSDDDEPEPPAVPAVATPTVLVKGSDEGGDEESAEMVFPSLKISNSLLRWRNGMEEIKGGRETGFVFVGREQPWCPTLGNSASFIEV